MTMQRYHYPCPGSSPHRLCFSVSEAVAFPEGEAVPRVAPPDRKVREELLFSCKVQGEVEKKLLSLVTESFGAKNNQIYKKQKKTPANRGQYTVMNLIRD